MTRFPVWAKFGFFHPNNKKDGGNVAGSGAKNRTSECQQMKHMFVAYLYMNSETVHDGSNKRSADSECL